jgi:hypothetical protein
VLLLTSSPATFCSTLSGTVEGDAWWAQLFRSSSAGIPICSNRRSPRQLIALAYRQRESKASGLLLRDVILEPQTRIEEVRFEACPSNGKHNSEDPCAPALALDFLANCRSAGAFYKRGASVPPVPVVPTASVSLDTQQQQRSPQCLPQYWMAYLQLLPARHSRTLPQTGSARS